MLTIQQNLGYVRWRVIKVNLMTDWLKMGKKEYNLETVTLTNVVCIVKI